MENNLKKKQSFRGVDNDPVIRRRDIGNHRVFFSPFYTLFKENQGINKYKIEFF